MKQTVIISIEESDNVRILHETYNAYMSVLQFFMNQETIPNQTIFDKKWNEAISIGRELENAKRNVEKKYKPSGDWDRFEFDFDNHQVVFIKDGT